MRIWQPCMAILLFGLAGCGSEAEPTFKDPAACIAAYSYAYDAGAGTSLANHPQRAEMKIRILFELEKLDKTEGRAEGQKRADAIRKKLNKNFDLANSLGVHCVAEAAANDEYDKARERLKAIADGKR